MNILQVKVTLLARTFCIEEHEHLRLDDVEHILHDIDVALACAHFLTVHKKEFIYVGYRRLDLEDIPGNLLTGRPGTFCVIFAERLICCIEYRPEGRPFEPPPQLALGPWHRAGKTAPFGLLL